MSSFVSYNSATKTYTIQPGAATSEIQSVINSAPNGATLFFAAGTHVLTERLDVIRDNITISGAGKDQTTFLVDHAGSVGQDAFFIRGSSSADWKGTVTSDIAAGSNTIQMTSVAGLKAGDVLTVFQKNDAAYLAATGNQGIATDSLTAKSPLREGMVQIDHIEGNTVYLKEEVPYAMTAAGAKVERYDLLDNINVHDFSITYNLPQPDHNLYANTNDKYVNTSALKIEATLNLEVKNIGMTNLGSNGLDIIRALQPTVDNFSADGTHNKGPEGSGNGYLLSIAETFHGNLDNLTLMNGRHGMLFSSWHAETNNNIHILKTNSDVNYHGSADHSNTVLVDEMIIRPGIDGNGDLEGWSVVSDGGTNHAASTIDANTNLFKYVVGSHMVDKATGWDGGAYMDGKGGNDVLKGGAGNDLINGGAGDDTLSGRGGADVFVAVTGEGKDIILDFDKNDKILISGAHNYLNASGVMLQQVGADAVLSLSGSSMVLKNFNVANWSSANVVLETTQTALNGTMVAGLDNLVGSAGVDKMIAYGTVWQSTDRINLGAGADTLSVVGRSFNLDTSTQALFSGVETIDTRGVTDRSMAIKLTNAAIDSASGDKISILTGANGLLSLDVSGVTSSQRVTLTGEGRVTLANTAGQSIWAESTTGTGLNIVGGTGNDTIRLQKGASIVSTGVGNDYVLVCANATHNVNLGDGDDRLYLSMDPSVRMTLNGGNGIDTLQFGVNVNLTAAEIAGFTMFDKLQFKGTTNFVGMTDGFSSGNMGLEGVVADAKLTLDVNALTKSKVFDIGENIEVTAQGANVNSMTFNLLDTANRQFTGSGGDDRINGGAADDVIFGGAGKDTIMSGAGNDTVNAGAGDDYIRAGAGNDDLWGGAGKDRFVYQDLSEGHDVIHDFNTMLAEGDFVDLVTLFDVNGLGAMSYASAIGGGYLSYTQVGSDVNINFDRDGSGGTLYSAVNIMTLENEVVADLTSAVIKV
jgi:Ca2+-binding RTX toxin-like protein